MPYSSKPILLICGSRSITDINLDLYIDSSKYGQIISGGANGVDTLAEQWAKRNDLEIVVYKPQYNVYGPKYAPLERDKCMVNACDEVVAFWDGESKGTLFTIKYAIKNDVPYTLHLIKDM